MIPNLNNPLILKVSDFGSLGEYISSLSKPARKDFKSTLSRNRNLEYRLIDYDVSLVQDYMDLWCSQPLSNGNFPIWGEWNSNSILNSGNDIMLFAGYLGNQDISIHFIFRWGNYLYCNAPLYNKELYPGLGKWMWIKLIEYCITDHSIDYLDFVAPEGMSTSWHEVVKSRVKSNSSGDFGYKWKFIPRDGKIYTTENPNYKIGFCKLCNSRWVYWDDTRKECENCLEIARNLIIVAHPDDESIFFGNWLSKNAENTRVVCVTGGYDEVRKSEFLKAMEILEIEDYEIWDYRFSLSPLEDSSSIYSDLQRLRFSEKWDCVITHSRYGEYGHIQHIEVHDMVVDVFSGIRIKVFSISSNPISNKDLEFKILLNRAYESQYRKGFEEILASLATGSDWYKHSVGFDMVRHESLIDIEKSISQLNISIIDPVEYSDFPFYENCARIASLLRGRGHKVDIRNSNDDLVSYDINIVYTLVDALEISKVPDFPFFFLCLDGTLKRDIGANKIRYTKEIIDKSNRTAFPDKSTRDLIGNPLNVVHLNMDSSWYEIIRQLESHIIRSIVAKRLSTSLSNPLTEISFDSSLDRLSFKYNGKSRGNCGVILEDQYGQALIRYSINLTSGGNYWIGVSRDWIGMDLKLVILDPTCYQEQWIFLDI